MLPASCKYTPSCSEYAMEAVERYGVMRGGLMSAWRLLRCNPFAKGGYDPVAKAGCRQATSSLHENSNWKTAAPQARHL